MSNRPPTLTTRDHQNMDAFLGQVLEEFKAGTITKEEATGSLAHVIAAIDIGNYSEAVAWFERGSALIKSTR